MKNKTKEDKLMLIMKITFVLVTFVIIAYIYIIVEYNGEEIRKKDKEDVNTIISSLNIEKTNIEKANIETVNKQEQISQVIPLINEPTQNKNNYYLFSQTKNNKYYYEQLNQNSKIIYNTIEQNLDNVKSGNYEIELPSFLGNEINENYELLKKDFQSAWDALVFDRVDTFFIDISNINLVIQKVLYSTNERYNLTIKPINDISYIENGLQDKKVLNEVLNQIYNKKQEIISSIDGETTYEKVLQVHDWIINNIEYSTEDSRGKNPYNIYGALIENYAVCEGYAETFKYILDELEIPCILVSGKVTNTNNITQNHEWNYVKIDNKWYAVDCTWDDPIIEGNGYLTNTEKHKYFLKGAKEINKNHVAIGNISENGQQFQYPSIETEDYIK